MEHLKRTYSIAFAGLKLGKHSFDFKVGNSFFDQIENSLIQEAAIDVSLELDKHDTMLILEFAFKGTISVECDRCTELFEMPVQSANRLIVKLGTEEAEEEENDEIVSIARNDGMLNVAPYIYEFTSLLVPLKKVHATLKECNQETIAVLKNLSVKSAPEETDPRWNALKKFNTEN